MNNEATKQGAARAVPVSTLSTYVAAPAAPAYATAAPAAAVASARMPAAFAPAAASTCVTAAAPAYASAATADALSTAPVAATAAPALAAIPGDDLAPDGAITAILPIYDDNGRGIVIYTADGGRRVTGRRMRSILQRLGGRQELPLPISPQLILVPCKVVTPRVKGDETIGYFSLAHICALHTLPHRSRGHAATAVRSGRKAPGDRAAAPVAARHAAAPAAARRAAEPSAARRAANPPVARAAAEKRRPPTAAKCPDASCFVSAARRAAELPVYELSDGRRVALLCTSDTARHRLEMAAYARCLMFGA